MSKMVTRNLKRKLDQVGNRNEQVPCEMQKDVCCNRQVTSNPSNVHYVNLIILGIEEQPKTYKMLFVTKRGATNYAINRWLVVASTPT
jgi:hypothetical protein